MDIPFELVDTLGATIYKGNMAWFYVQPRIILYKGDYYAMLSIDLAPGPSSEHKYVLVGPARHILDVDDKVDPDVLHHEFQKPDDGSTG